MFGDDLGKLIGKIGKTSRLYFGSSAALVKICYKINGKIQDLQKTSDPKIINSLQELFEESVQRPQK